MDRVFDMSADTKHYTKKYLIPRTLQPHVCMCDEPGGVLFGHRKPGPAMNCCNVCLKPYRWYVRICTSCRAFYIRDFRRSKSCIRHQKCYDCFTNVEPCNCDSVWQEGMRDFGPLGLNPRTYTAEETAGIFDSGGPF